MNFKAWLEDKEWYLFGETVVLYHGTSSALLNIIKTEGIKPPEENLEEYALRLVQRYIKNPPPELLKKIESNALSFRKDNKFHKTSNVIYLDGSFKEAQTYAEHYFKYGGEIAYTIWRECAAWLKQDIRPMYDSSHPIVVEVEIPWKWMETYIGDLKEKYRKLINVWRQWDHKHHDTFSDFLKTNVQPMEVRVRHPIAPRMIRQIHDIPRPQLHPGEPES